MEAVMWGSKGTQVEQFEEMEGQGVYSEEVEAVSRIQSEQFEEV
jgi:hypothetical protein